MVFKVMRLIPGNKVPQPFFVEADNGAFASTLVDELMYAIMWHKGFYPDRDHKTRPEGWAFNVTNANGQTKEVV